MDKLFLPSSCDEKMHQSLQVVEEDLQGLKFTSTMKPAAATAVLKDFGKFLEPALPFLNCHFTDYHLKSYWTSLIPDKLRRDLESKSLSQVEKCVTDLTTSAWKTYQEDGTNITTVDFQNCSTLEQLVVSVGKLKLTERNLCVSFADLQDARSVLKETFPDKFVDLEFDKFMSSKKMHEVLQFSELIASACSPPVNLWGTDKPHENENESSDCQLAERSQVERTTVSQGEIRHIVDVGSGKGYLSSFLALYFDLKILAIDASDVNTRGCERRSAKLDKTWPQLVRRAKERRDHGICTNVGKRGRRKLAKMGIPAEELRSKNNLEEEAAERNLKSITEMISTKTNLQSLVDASFGATEGKTCDGEGDYHDDTSIKYGIVGLHTCGNLGSNILKLFLHNKRANFICVIPCCYNLVQEDESLYPDTVFYGSKFGNCSTSEKPGNESCSANTKNKSCGPWPDGSIGFPLSSVLQKYGDKGEPMVIGRNARMLSAYSLPRMINSESGLEMPKVLYYRAMLQVLLQRHNLLPESDEDDPGARVGRMTKKCETFQDYVGFALKRLGVSAEISQESIDQVETEYATSEILDKFHKYYLLRTMFASAVEDLILLDRLVYLDEQECISSAAILQLFDPSVSPRCHAIVARKKST